MQHVVLAEPVLIPIFFLGFLILLVFATLIAVVVFLLVRKSSAKSAVALSVPPAETFNPVIPKKCPQCGAQLRSDVPEGLCPACLLLRGIATEGGVPPGTPAFTPPPLAELAKLFPQLEILEPLGQGGMGAVYKARQPALDRFVALKILAPRGGGDLDFAGRFSREARALAKLSHPNIVAVYDFGQIANVSSGTGGQASSLSPSETSGQKLETGRMPVLHYFLMEYVDGPNLREVEQAGKLTPREALQIIPQICAALQFAHDEGIVHRDIKPENVLLDKKGRVKIADFGLAKILGQEADFRLTGARDVMGTPHYMAPEQVEKPQEVDHRADIYSLGVVFYEMLTGELPLGKFDPPSHKVQIDVRLDEVVLRSLANNPDRRYQHVSEVKTELESIASGPPLPKPPVKSEVSSSRARAVALTTINILLALLLVFGGWAANQAGMFFNVVYFFILLMVPIRIVVILWHAVQDGLEYRLWRKPLAAEFAKYWWQVANRCIFWLLTWAVLQTCLVPAQFTSAQYSVMHGLYLAGIIALILLELLPARRLRVATNVAFAIGSIFMATQMVRIYWPASKADGVALSMPVRGDWLVLHGGRSSLINNHYGIEEQRDAIDMEKLTDGHERNGDPRKLESYPSWGETLFAPADGKVAVTVNDLDDNAVGEMDEINPLGNHICLDIGGGRYVLMAHLKKGSVLVSEGDVVHTGQPLAKCGNSGNTSHPHLHIQVQNTARLFVTGQPKARTYSILFRDATRVRGNHEDSGAPFFVRRNDRIVSERNAFVAAPSPVVTASVETWTPTFPPGEKPDFAKILQDAKDLMGKGHYEEALGRYIWFQNHVPEYGDSYQNIVRMTSAITDWIELGRRYPKAKKALLEIRDRKVNEFTQGHGYSDLFNEIMSINHELQDEDATYELFKAIRKGDPKLAQQLYYYVEALLVSKGEYQWCYETMRDPDSRVAQMKQSFERELDMQKRSAEMQERNRKQMAEWDRKAGRTNSPIFSPPDTAAEMGRSATNRFAGSVGLLVEILVGTGHSTEAEKIRDEAITVMDDPRIKSAVADAEARIQKRKVAASVSADSKDGSLLEKETADRAFANLKIPSFIELNGDVTNGPAASLETWSPTLRSGEQPDLMKIQQEATDLTKAGHYEESLQRHIWYHDHSRTDSSQAGVRNSFALDDWIELGRRYPKARRALLEIRDADAQKSSQSQGYFDLFLELSSINGELGDSEATYRVFKEMTVNDKKLAQQCYPLVEGLLMSHGDYELCLDYLGDPQTKFETIRRNWEMRKNSEQRQDEMQRQTEQRMRDLQKQQGTNGSGFPMAMSTRMAFPKFADNNFVGEVRNLIEILVATKRDVDAQKIHDEAVLLLDDARLKSAVSDAEEKITTRTIKPAFSK